MEKDKKRAGPPMPKKKNPFGIKCLSVSCRLITFSQQNTRSMADDLQGKSTPRHLPAAMQGWYLLNVQNADSQSASPILLSTV